MGTLRLPRENFTALPSYISGSHQPLHSYVDLQYPFGATQLRETRASKTHSVCVCRDVFCDHIRPRTSSTDLRSPKLLLSLLNDRTASMSALRALAARRTPLVSSSITKRAGFHYSIVRAAGKETHLRKPDRLLVAASAIALNED